MSEFPHPISKSRLLQRDIAGIPHVYESSDREALTQVFQSEGVSELCAKQLAELMIRGLNFYMEHGEPKLFTGSADDEKVEAALKDITNLDHSIKKALENYLFSRPEYQALLSKDVER